MRERPGRIVYGTAWKKTETTRLVTQAVLAGFRAIDTACQPKHYQEDLVGEALQTLYDKHGFKREDLFIQTKFTPIGGQDRSQPLPYDPTSSITEQVQASIQVSLKNLRTTYIDSYLLHSPLNTMWRTLEAWEALKRLQDDGVVRLIGVSNTYDVETLKSLETQGGRKPNVVQNRWYEGNGFDRAVVHYCKENSIYYESFWTLTGSPTLLNSPSLEGFAKKKGLTKAQTMYRLVQHWGIIPLAGSTNEQHIKDGVEVESAPLSDEEVPSDIYEYVWGK